MDDEMTPEQKAEIEAMLHPYQDLESAAINLALDHITYRQKDVTSLYRTIIKELRRRFDWIPHPAELYTELDKQVWVEADRAIKEGIREAIATFEEEESEYVSPSKAVVENSHLALSPADAIRAWLSENDYLPPVKCLALFSKVAPADERAFYNAIQNSLRAEGWNLELTGRGQGYKVVARPDVGKKVEEAAEMLKALDPETLDQVLSQIRSSLGSTTE